MNFWCSWWPKPVNPNFPKDYIFHVQLFSIFFSFPFSTRVRPSVPSPLIPWTFLPPLTGYYVKKLHGTLNIYIYITLGRWSHFNSSSSCTFTKSLWFLLIFNTCLHKEKRWHTSSLSSQPNTFGVPKAHETWRSVHRFCFIEWQATTYYSFEVNQSFYDWGLRF